MKKFLFTIVLTALAFATTGQELSQPEFDGQSCTSIMVGKRASRDGSVITSHTCDGRYRTWMHMEPAADHEPGTVHPVYKGTLHTTFRGDTTGVKLVGAIPEAAHTYAYLNTAYPCLNEHQLSIGESTFGGPDTLRNPAGMFLIEELERVALQRCTTARDAIRLIGGLVKVYGYADGGECITIADPKEVWQMEILGEGKDNIGGVWAAQRIPDDHVGVSCNIPRIGRLQRANTEYFMCSDNIEAVARRYGLWDGKGEFIFWKAFNSSYANGKNFREREYFILNALAPSMELTMDTTELPFSVRPDRNVDVRKVMELLRSTYEGTDMDMPCSAPSTPLPPARLNSAARLAWLGAPIRLSPSCATGCLTAWEVSAGCPSTTLASRLAFPSSAVAANCPSPTASAARKNTTPMPSCGNTVVPTNWPPWLGSVPKAR